MISSHDENADSARVRKFYSITKKVRGMLEEKENEWKAFASAINRVLKGGVDFAVF